MSFQKICPYPGLRPFNEDESIYFKGREEHIDKIITLLQEKKFLMVTGASGDGKSSLIYAGLIPRSRAGFFKANFNNWRIADLRPERSPLGNLARAIT
jgi:ABC-type ATPase involved in cell division